MNREAILSNIQIAYDTSAAMHACICVSSTSAHMSDCQWQEYLQRVHQGY